jgi:hypothetical protein
MLWHVDAITQIESALAAMPQVVEFHRKGSILAPDSMDEFSDLDLELTFTEPQPDAHEWLDALFREIAPVFTCEHHRGSEDALRICLENGWRIDFTCRPGFLPEAPPQELGDKIAALSSRFWFTAVMACIRLARKDHLIASHLALELWREILVLHMLERDNRAGTNHHRFGAEETVEFLHTILRPHRPTDAHLILGMIQGATAVYFRNAAPFDPLVSHKLSIFSRLCDEWLS